MPSDPPPIPQPAPCPAPPLETRGLALDHGSRRIIDGLDLALPRHAVTALVGPNGSGKSTLLRALAGLHPAARGTILLNGRPIARQTPRRIARQVGMLPQGPDAPEGLSVDALVRMGRNPHRPLFGTLSHADRAACDAALDQTAMTALRDTRVDRLSGGQRQRAWIALTLAQQTPVLLLDEPTSFLDMAHQIEVMSLVRGLVRNGQKTVVAVLHDLNQAGRYADHMIMLRDGRVRAMGPPAEIMTLANIRAVFDFDALIRPDPVSGTPMCIPLAR